jgi:hypothetical protein
MLFAVITSGSVKGMRQTEGQITKHKLVKRQMHGRCKIDLLEALVMGVRRYITFNFASEPKRDPLANGSIMLPGHIGHFGMLVMETIAKRWPISPLQSQLPSDCGCGFISLRPN